MVLKKEINPTSAIVFKPGEARSKQGMAFNTIAHVVISPLVMVNAE